MMYDLLLHITNEVFKEIWLTITKAGYALGGGLLFSPKDSLTW